MEQKFSDVYRTSFLTLDRYLQQTNNAQMYFRPLLPPLNTATGEFYSLSPAQGTDPSIRINKYSSNGTFLGFGYLYDTSFNVPPDTSGGGTNYWTLTGSNISNNNPGFVGIGTTTPAYPLQVVQPTTATGLSVVTAGTRGIRVTQSGYTLPAEIYFDNNSFLSPLIPPGSIGTDTSPRGMFVFYNGKDRINITPNGYMGINTAPVPATRTLEVSGNASIHGPALSNLLFVGDASLNNPVAEQDTVKIGTAGVGGRLVLGDDGKGVLRLLNQDGYTYIETGTNMAVGSSGRLIFSSMFDLSGGPTMTVNTGTDEVVISNRYIDPPVANYTLTVDGSANVLGNLRSAHHLPQASYTYDLGASGEYWRDLYLSTGTIYMGPTATIGADGSGNVLVNKSSGYGLGVGVTRPATSLEVSGQTTLTQDIPYASRTINPLPSQLIVRGYNASNRLVVGSYYTGGEGTAASLQASDYYGGIDHGTNILLNPLGGNVGIGLPTPGVVLDVSGAVRASAGVTAPQAIASSLSLGSRYVYDVSQIPNPTTTVWSNTENVASLPYSVFLVTVEGCIITPLSGGTITATVTLDNGEYSVPKTYPVSASFSVLSSVAAPFTSTTPIDKGYGTITVTVSVSGGGYFLNNSNIYVTVTGMC